MRLMIGLPSTPRLKLGLDVKVPTTCSTGSVDRLSAREILAAAVTI